MASNFLDRVKSHQKNFELEVAGSMTEYMSLEKAFLDKCKDISTDSRAVLAYLLCLMEFDGDILTFNDKKYDLGGSNIILVYFDVMARSDDLLKTYKMERKNSAHHIHSIALIIHQCVEANKMIERIKWNHKIDLLTQSRKLRDALKAQKEKKKKLDDELRQVVKAKKAIDKQAKIVNNAFYVVDKILNGG